MPETSTQGEGWATLEAKVIRADGTEEDLGVVASTEPPVIRRFQCVSSNASVEVSDGDTEHPPVFLSYGDILIVEGPVTATATYGTIHELQAGDEENLWVIPEPPDDEEKED